MGAARHVHVGLELGVAVAGGDGHVPLAGGVVGLEGAVVHVEVPGHPEAAAGLDRARPRRPRLADGLVAARLERTERLGRELAEGAGLVVQGELADEPVDDGALVQGRLAPRGQGRLQPHARALQPDLAAAEGVGVDPLVEDARALGDGRLVGRARRDVGLELLDGGAEGRRQVVVAVAVAARRAASGGPAGQREGGNQARDGSCRGFRSAACCSASFPVRSPVCHRRIQLSPPWRRQQKRRSRHVPMAREPAARASPSAGDAIRMDCAAPPGRLPMSQSPSPPAIFATGFRRMGYSARRASIGLMRVAPRAGR